VSAAAALLCACGGGSDTPRAPAPREFAQAAALDDVAVFPGSRATYTIVRTDSAITVIDNVGGSGTTDVTGRLSLKFDDFTVNLGIQPKSQTIAATDLQTLVELYVAFFNRVPDADGLAYWIDQFQSGQTLNQIADGFYAAGVHFSSLTGYSDSMTNADFVTIVYKNVLGRPSVDQDGLTFWTSRLADGTATRGTLVRAMLDSAHTFKGDATWGWVADLLDNKYAVANYFSIQQGLNYNTPEDSITGTIAIAAAVTPTDTTAAIQLIGITNTPPPPPPPPPGVSFSRVYAIVNQRCVPCHSPTPDRSFGFIAAPKGITLDTEAKIRALKSQIYANAVQTTNMPYLNRTGMTRDERADIGEWYLNGAP
jgi:hypothetical protein